MIRTGITSIRNSDSIRKAHPNQKRPKRKGASHFDGGAFFAAFGEDDSDEQSDEQSDDDYLPPEPVYAKQLHGLEKKEEKKTPKRRKSPKQKVERAPPNKSNRKPRSTLLQDLLDKTQSSAVVKTPQWAQDPLQLDEILTKTAVELGVVDETTLSDSIHAFNDRLQKLTSDSITRFNTQLENESMTDEVIAEAKHLFEVHLRRNERCAFTTKTALRNMHAWASSETRRIRTNKEAQLERVGNKNGVELGFDPFNRMQLYRCIGDHVTTMVNEKIQADNGDKPICSTVFSGKFLTPDGEVRTRIDQFSYLTLGLCPNCLNHYSVRDVNVEELVDLARGNVRTRERVQNWSEPKVRPTAADATDMTFSEDLERKLLAHQKKNRKKIDGLIDVITRHLETCVEKLENPLTTDPLHVVRSTFSAIMSVSEPFSSDDMNDEQWKTFRRIIRRITTMRDEQEARAKQTTHGGCATVRRSPIRSTLTRRI